MKYEMTVQQQQEMEILPDVAPDTLAENYFIDNGAELSQVVCTEKLLLAIPIDCSYSMNGYIPNIVDGIGLVSDVILSNQLPKYMIEICIIKFGETVEVVRPFTPVENFAMPELSDLRANGSTPMGEALKVTHQLFTERLTQLNQEGISSKRGFVMMLTDGQATDKNSEEWIDGVNVMSDAIANKYLEFIAFGLGNNVDYSGLSQITGARLSAIDEQKLHEVFSWLYESVSLMAQSRPGESFSAPDSSGFTRPFNT